MEVRGVQGIHFHGHGRAGGAGGIAVRAGIRNSCYSLDSGSRPRCGLGRNDVGKDATNFRNRTVA